MLTYADVCLASGLSFVGFEKAEDAHAAVQKLDGQAIAGKRLKVQVQGQLQESAPASRAYADVC